MDKDLGDVEEGLESLLNKVSDDKIEPSQFKNLSEAVRTKFSQVKDLFRDTKIKTANKKSEVHRRLQTISSEMVFKKATQEMQSSLDTAPIPTAQAPKSGEKPQNQQPSANDGPPLNNSPSNFLTTGEKLVNLVKTANETYLRDDNLAATQKLIDALKNLLDHSEIVPGFNSVLIEADLRVIEADYLKKKENYEEYKESVRELPGELTAMVRSIKELAQDYKTLPRAHRMDKDLGDVEEGLDLLLNKVSDDKIEPSQFKNLSEAVKTKFSQVKDLFRDTKTKMQSSLDTASIPGARAPKSGEKPQNQGPLLRSLRNMEVFPQMMSEMVFKKATQENMVEWKKLWAISKMEREKYTRNPTRTAYISLILKLDEEVRKINKNNLQDPDMVSILCAHQEAYTRILDDHNRIKLSQFLIKENAQSDSVFIPLEKLDGFQEKISGILKNLEKSLATSQKNFQGDLLAFSRETGRHQVIAQQEATGVFKGTPYEQHFSNLLKVDEDSSVEDTLNELGTYLRLMKKGQSQKNNPVAKKQQLVVKEEDL